MLVASQKAEQGARRLLTAQGEDLGEAVVLAFTDLGFDVQDLDEERDRSGLPRVEDLNLTCPDQPEVRILAEVKGYAKGAKAGDLIQIGHHAVRYTQRQGGPQTGPGTSSTSSSTGIRTCGRRRLPVPSRTSPRSPPRGHLTLVLATPHPRRTLS